MDKDLEILRKALSRRHPVDPCHEALSRVALRTDALHRELSHLVRLLEPLERAGALNVPGLATLNGARAALDR